MISGAVQCAVPKHRSSVVYFEMMSEAMVTDRSGVRLILIGNRDESSGGTEISQFDIAGDISQDIGT